MQPMERCGHNFNQVHWSHLRMVMAPFRSIRRYCLTWSGFGKYASRSINVFRLIAQHEYAHGPSSKFTITTCVLWLIARSSLCCKQLPDEYADSYTLSGCNPNPNWDLCGVYTRVPAHCITDLQHGGSQVCPGGPFDGVIPNIDPTLCGGAPVYQKGGVDGPVLLLTGQSPATMQWYVGGPESLAMCMPRWACSGAVCMRAAPHSNSARTDNSNPGYAPPTAYSRWWADSWPDNHIQVVAGGGR